MLTEEVLNHFRDSKALLEGHFELRSGLHSNQYFQCALVLQYPDRAEALCRAAVQKLRKLYPDIKPDAVISPALGGIPVGHETGRALGVRAVFAEKKDNALIMRRFKILPGEHYVVAEDVITRGGRVQETIDIVENAGGVVDAVLVLVDRSGGRFKPSAPLVSLLQMEPVTWAPEDCPLCRDQLPLTHPGS